MNVPLLKRFLPALPGAWSLVPPHLPGTEAGVNVPLLKHLVDGSRGGQLYAQRGFGRSLAPALKACLSGCIGTRGTMDVFCSDGLRLAQCIGALDEQQKLVGGGPCKLLGAWSS